MYDAKIQRKGNNPLVIHYFRMFFTSEKNRPENGESAKIGNGRRNSIPNFFREPDLSFPGKSDFMSVPPDNVDRSGNIIIILPPKANEEEEEEVKYQISQDIPM